MRERGHTPLFAACEKLTLQTVCEPVRNVALEATAWFVTAGADAVDLRALLASENTRLVTRALAALLFQPPEQLAPAALRLRELTAMPQRQGLKVGHRSFDIQLARQVRVLAALVVAHGGDVPDGGGGLQRLVTEACGVTLAGLPRFVEQQRQAGTLVQLVDDLEAACRPCFGVPPELVWPHADAR
jgi:hypothetical protein